MTLEQLIAKRDQIISQMANPQDVRGPGGVGATFRSQADLDKALTAIDTQIAKINGTTPQRVSFVSFSKG